MQSPLIVAGCYERFLFAFAPPSQLDSEAAQARALVRCIASQGRAMAIATACCAMHASQEPTTLERKYTFAAHKHQVKCVAGVGPFLASGGADDTIHLYDIQHDKDLGFLMNPGDGAVPCIKFFSPSRGAAATHMFSGSADGSISIWQVGGGWEHLKTMRGHKASVNDLAVHHSGRLALSVARDSHIRMWNLLKGRCSYTATLEIEGDMVEFLPSGDAYALVCGSQVTVHSTSGEGGVRATLSHARRVQCMAQTSEDLLMTGVEDGSVKVWDLRTSSCVHSMERMHSSRVRGLAVLNAGTGSIPELFSTASSDGVVKVWDSRMLPTTGSSRCVSSAETRARITCLCVVQPITAKSQGSKPQAKQQGAVAGGRQQQAPKKAQQGKAQKQHLEGQQQQQRQAGSGAVQSKKLKVVAAARQGVSSKPSRGTSHSAAQLKPKPVITKTKQAPGKAAAAAEASQRPGKSKPGKLGAGAARKVPQGAMNKLRTAK